MERQLSHEEQLLESLTEKQRQVLDLLLEHKTSKEIARVLRISPHTVDQRIQFAREKLGAQTRSEAAVAYRRLLEICGQLTYEDSGIAPAEVPTHDPSALQGSEARPRQRTQAQSAPSADTEMDYAVVRELFEGRHASLVRLGAIIAIAVLLVILVVGGLAILAELSRLMAG